MPRSPSLRSRRATYVVLLLIVTAVAGTIAYPRVVAYRHWRQARAAIAREDFEAAQAHLAICQRARPAHPTYVFERGRLARRERDFRTAQSLLTRAGSLGHPQEQIRLEELLLTVQQTGWRGKDELLLNMLERGTPDEARVREVLADAYYRDYLLSAALEQAQKWVASEPESPSAWLLIGHIRMRLRERVAARDAYRRAVELDPTSLAARVGYGSMLLRQNQPAEAATQFEEAVRIQGRDREARLGLARSLLQLDRIAECKSVISLLFYDYPRDAEVAGLAGQVSLRDGALNDAERFLKLAAATTSDLVVLHDLQQVLVRLDKVAEARDLQARIDRLRSDFDRIDNLTRAAQVSLDPAPRVEAGLILIRNGLPQDGLGWLRDAVRCDPRYRPAHAALADYFRDRGELEEAEYHRRLAGPG